MTMLHRLSVRLSACLASMLVAALPSAAVTVTDATGDFLPGYTGPRLADLDVTRFSVAYDSVAEQFLLGATFAGAVDPATAGFYIIGVNTGRGQIAPFGSIGQGNVTFDQAIRINKNGTGAIGAATIDPASIVITGDSFAVRIAGSLLPSTGAQLQDYGFNLWPRVGFGNNAQISDFAPENAVLSVPEPKSWLLMLTGIFAVAGVARRRRHQASRVRG